MEGAIVFRVSIFWTVRIKSSTLLSHAPGRTLSSESRARPPVLALHTSLRDITWVTTIAWASVSLSAKYSWYCKKAVSPQWFPWLLWGYLETSKRKSWLLLSISHDYCIPAELLRDQTTPPWQFRDWNDAPTFIRSLFSAVPHKT